MATSGDLFTEAALLDRRYSYNRLLNIENADSYRQYTIYKASLVLRNIQMNLFYTTTTAPAAAHLAQRT